MNWAFPPSADAWGVGPVLGTLQLPANYLIFDVETAGFHPKAPIVQIGWGVVADHQLMNVESLLVDWTHDPSIDQRWLESQLSRIAADMARQGRRFCTDYSRMAREGLPPVEVMQVFAVLLEEYLQPGGLLVGHNAWAFDRPRIDYHMVQLLGRGLNWHANSVFDTGLVEKAVVMNRPPYPGETYEDWYRRINSERCTSKWNLEKHCADKYQLQARYGVDTSLAHDAGQDCRLVYCLFDTFRIIAEAYHGQEGGQR